MEISQTGHFDHRHLKNLFETRVIKSQAVGLDGTRLKVFGRNLDEETNLISRKVLASTYRFTPYREKLISRGSDRLPRQISIPTVRDRLALRAACNSLSALAPASRTLPPHRYIKSISDLIRGSTEPLSFLRVDVRDFFPNIDHTLLTEQLKNIGVERFLLDFMQKALSNPTGFTKQSSPRTVGIPQGLSVSSILSSIYMIEFDRTQIALGTYHRYVDDILIVCPSRELKNRYISVHDGLSKLMLTPHAMGRSGKTEEKRISDGIDYIGYHLTPLKTSVRDSSYNRMFANLSKVFTFYKYKRNYNQFIFKLNLRITGCIVDGKRKGWLMFFSQTEDMSQLRFLDDFVKLQIARVGVPYDKEPPCRFIKTYYEIRYKGESSNYIPNFDAFSLEQQYELISSITGASMEELASRSIEITDTEFKTIVAREVADLEQDLLDSFS
ncbi:reverse transcriptase domain-containing protein [Sphingomonas sp. RT2P30]|uniref:reverse transcriptase domain-containing protein n=1 Tax=Parasphingomonas halimpatiens TaxID=3096162 RepID=UPI002FC86DC2